MIPIHKEFPNIRYQKITWENIEDLTPELIEQIAKTGSFGYTTKSWEKHKLKIIKDKTRMIYLIKDGPKVLGFINGDLRTLSDYYTDLRFEKFMEEVSLSKKRLSQKEIDDFYSTRKVNAEGNIFDVYEFGIGEEYQGKDLGTLLMERVVADQRVKYKSKFVVMYPTENTRKVNKRVTGILPVVVKIPKKNEDDKSEIEKTKKVLRNFKRSSFKYDLKPFNSEQKIIINQNPNQKREIRSKAK